MDLIFTLFSFFSHSTRTTSNPKLVNGNNQMGRATCFLNGQAELTSKGIKAVAKSQKNIGAGSLKSDFKKKKREKEIQIKIP